MSFWMWVLCIFIVLFFWRALAWGFGITVGAVVGVLFVMFMLTGCASTLTPDEVAYNRQQSRENWALCEHIMELQHVPQATHDHHHGKDDRYLRMWMVKQDLANNFCRARLGDLWAESI